MYVQTRSKNCMHHTDSSEVVISGLELGNESLSISNTTTTLLLHTKHTMYMCYVNVRNVQKSKVRKISSILFQKSLFVTSRKKRTAFNIYAHISGQFSS